MTSLQETVLCVLCHASTSEEDITSGSFQETHFGEHQEASQVSLLTVQYMYTVLSSVRA